VHARNEKSLGDALGAVVKARAHALLLTPDPFFADRRQQIIDFTTRNKPPAIYFGQFQSFKTFKPFGYKPKTYFDRFPVSIFGFRI
jgi:hypothetical protein